MHLLQRTNTGIPHRKDDQFTRIFNDMFGQWEGLKPAKFENQMTNFSPSVNLKEDDEKYTLEAELAGIDKNDIDVSIKDHAIHLKGEKKTFNEETKDNFHNLERSYGSFYRTIQLGTDADDEKIVANFENGLLTLEVAKNTSPEKGYRKISF